MVNKHIQIAHVFLWICASLIAASYSDISHANTTCSGIEADTEAILHPGQLAKEWTDFTGLKSQLKVEYFFTQEFIAKITETYGRPVLQFSSARPEANREEGLFVTIMAQDKRFGKFTLYPRKGIEGGIEVHGLVLQNHLRDGKEKLAADQLAPGLPPTEFTFANKGLMHLLQKGPYKFIYMQSSQHFGVAKLYERLSGFKPFDKKSQMHMDMLESYRKEARKWPEDIQLKSVDSLVEAMGAYNTTAQHPYLLKVWKKFLEDGTLPDNVEVKVDTGNMPYAIILREPTGPTVRFINSILPDRPLYNWRTMCESGYCAMSRQIQ